MQAFGDRASLSAWLASGAPEVPDIVIVDHRLVEPGDGLLALAQLRAAWPGCTVPAVLVSGSLLEAPALLEGPGPATALHVLRKPVAPGRLRALIGFLLAPPAGAPPAR